MLFSLTWYSVKKSSSHCTLPTRMYMGSHPASETFLWRWGIWPITLSVPSGFPFSAWKYLDFIGRLESSLQQRHLEKALSITMTWNNEGLNSTSQDVSFRHWSHGTSFLWCSEPVSLCFSTTSVWYGNVQWFPGEMVKVNLIFPHTKTSYFTESLNHRMVEAGRDCWRLSYLTFLFKAWSPTAVVQDHTHLGSDYL